MSKYLSKLKEYLKTFAGLFNRYSSVIFFVVFAALAGYLVMRIGTLARLEPTQAELDTKLSEIKKTKIDTDAVDKLQELEERDISIEALFDNGRTNPFED